MSSCHWSTFVRYTLGSGAVLLGAMGSWCAADDPSDFDKRIAPILARRCLECHNASDRKGGLDLAREDRVRAGGDSGPPIAPGDPGASLLWDYVASGEMPPERPPLPDEEKRALRDWIASGAKWGSGPIDPFRWTTDRRAGYDWWALGRLRRPPVPADTTGWSRNPVDRFIAAKLGERQLAPQGSADRRTLVRRLSFDLLGLPPTPEEVRHFVEDDAVDAYERLVARLLAAPAYGERWGRHWLDVARFGESQGFERDKLRTNAWPYRDWVIAALNADEPYDRFVRYQLAGDVLDGDRGGIATGYLVAAPYDEVGQSQQSAAMKAVVRQDELEDLVASVGQTFLGLTVNCARCHDHKFDPITQQEYYQLSAALAGVRHGERKTPAAMLRDAELSARALGGTVEQLRARIAEIEQPVRERVLAARATAPAPDPPAPAACWDFSVGTDDLVGDLDLRLRGTARVDNGLLVLDGNDAYAASVPLPFNLSEKTLEVWVRLAGLDQRGGAAIGVQTPDGSTFDAIVFGEREAGQWMAGSNHFARTQSFGGPAERDADGVLHMILVYEPQGSIRAYRNGALYGKGYAATETARFAAGRSQVLLGLRHSPAGSGRMLAGSILKAALYDRALSPAEVAAASGVPNRYVTESELVAGLTADEAEERQRLNFEIGKLDQQQREWRADRYYAVDPGDPEITYVLERGNPARKTVPAAPRGIAAVAGPDADFHLNHDAPDHARRTALAHWITDPHNPLVSRVIVNRLWHLHFGAGLVDTPNDFGFNGGRPSHPELLDWLASELVRNDWSLKSIHGLIVTSATYRQRLATEEDPGHALDADNRLLWHRPPRRLEAEAIRDSILAAAGQLNRSMYGPGFEDFTTHVHNTQFYAMLDPVGASFHRRSIYRTWVRSGRNRLLDAFDCPDPSTMTPRRARTTTPLQALSLLNHSFVLRMADRFAERIEAEMPEGDVAEHTGRAFEVVFGRKPDEAELELAVSYVIRHGLDGLGRVLFNSNEFLYID